MSQENVEIVRGNFGAAERHAWNDVLAAYSPEVEWDDRDLRPEGAVHQGIDAMTAEMRAWFGAWSNYTQQLERVVDVGDHVVVILREGGEAKTSGLPLDHVIGMVYTFAERRIVRVRLFREPRNALEAVGLSE
jgi:ketosteroid isomerase-like protein